MQATSKGHHVASATVLKDQLVVPQDKVCDLSIILDSRLNMEAHVANVVHCSFYQLQ